MLVLLFKYISRHFKAKHNPRKMKWTKAYRKAAGKEMVVDATFAFEKRRNCPVRYDRDVVVKTVQAMKIIDKIKNARKDTFYIKRMARARVKQTALGKRELERHDTLLRAKYNVPAAIVNEKTEEASTTAVEISDRIKQLEDMEMASEQIKSPTILMNKVKESHR